MIGHRVLYRATYSLTYSHIYLESENQNLAKYALKHPKTFDQDFKAATKISNLKAEDVKFFLARGIMRVKCKNEKQQHDLSTVKKFGDIQVTASLPWALSQNEIAVKQNRAKNLLNSNL